MSNFIFHDYIRIEMANTAYCQLEAKLRSFKNAQQPFAFHNVKLPFEQFLKKVTLYVTLELMMGDVEGGDPLCSCLQTEE
jgi:hypothetical protein